MPNSLLTEQEVKDKLGISDFRSISKDKLVEFVSAIPDMDKEVAINCIQQFPNFSETTHNVISRLKESCDSILANDKDNYNTAVKSYQSVLDQLSKLLENGELTESERRYIIEKEVEIADKVAECYKNSQNFSASLLQTLGGVGAVGLIILAATLGVSFYKK